MIDPSEIGDALVEKLRAIPELVEQVGNDAERIYAYHDSYPERASLAVAIHQMPVPSIMVVWEGTGPGHFGTVEVWKHNFGVYLRAGQELAGNPPAGYYRLFRLITRGTPVPDAQPLIYTTVHPNCHPMDTPAIERHTDAEGLDYMRVPVSFTEIGDE